MRTIMIRVILGLLLLACGSIQLMADGSTPRPPLCPPGSVCPGN